MTDIVEEMRADADAGIGWAAKNLRRAADEIEQLRAALQAIDGINDNPSCFRIDIDQIIRRALEGK